MWQVEPVTPGKPRVSDEPTSPWPSSPGSLISPQFHFRRREGIWCGGPWKSLLEAPLGTIGFSVYYQIPTLLWEETIHFLLICLTSSPHGRAFYPSGFSLGNLVFVADELVKHQKAGAVKSFSFFCVSACGDKAELA